MLFWFGWLCSGVVRLQDWQVTRGGPSGLWRLGAAVRRLFAVALALVVVASGVEAVTVAPKAGASTVVSAPLPPGVMSVPESAKQHPAGVPPTQAPGAETAVSKRIKAQIAARGHALPVAAGLTVPADVAARNARLASAQARYLVGPVGKPRFPLVGKPVPVGQSPNRPGTRPAPVLPPDNAVGR